MKKFLLLVFVIAVPAAYGDQIDQSLTLTSLLPRDGFISGAMDALTPPILTAQTFTAGLTGNLTGVSVLVVQPSNVQMPVADVQVGIYNTANGIPLGSPLFTTTINPKSSGGTVGGATVLLGLSDIIPISNVSVLSGQTYAIGVQAVNLIPHTCCEMYQLGLFPSDGRDPYPAGSWLSWSGKTWLPVSTSPPGDAFFATYVNPSAVTPVPEPSSLILMIAGAMILIGLAWSKNLK